MSQLKLEILFKRCDTHGKGDFIFVIVDVNFKNQTLIKKL